MELEMGNLLVRSFLHTLMRLKSQDCRWDRLGPLLADFEEEEIDSLEEEWVADR